jgi:hypothetical protein
VALTIGADAEATASGLIEHTADLGGAALGNISSFGIDSRGELFIVSYSAGQVMRIVNASASAPSTPRNLRIIR